MEGWKEVLLDKIAWFRGSGVNKLLSTNEDMVSLINYMDVYKNWQIKQRKDYQKVTAKIREIKEANLLEGDILFTPSSEKPIDIGHAGVVMENMPNCVYSYHLIRGRLYQKDMFDKLFLSYLLNTYKVQKHFVTRASGSGIRYTLSLRDFKSLKITYPASLAEQSAIAKILSTVDEAIRSTRETISKLERVKKSLMQNLLSGKMKPDGTLRPAAEFYEDDKMGLVPKGWTVKAIGEIADMVQYGLNIPSVDGGKYPMLRMNNIIKFEMVGNPLVYVNIDEYTFNQYCLEYGDILFNRTNSMDLVGKVGIYKLKGDYVFASYLIRVKVNGDNNPFYVNYVLNSYPTQCALRAKATPAVSQANINSKSLRRTFIMLPLLEEQNQIVEQLDTLTKTIQQKQEKITTLELLKKSLMQQLLTGRVRVNG